MALQMGVGGTRALAHLFPLNQSIEKMVKDVEKKMVKIGEKHEEIDGKQVWKIMTFWKNV